MIGRAFEKCPYGVLIICITAVNGYAHFQEINQSHRSELLLSIWMLSLHVAGMKLENYNMFANKIFSMYNINISGWGSTTPLSILIYSLL